MKTKYSIILLFVITSLSAFSQSKLKLDLINNSYEIGDTVVVKLDNTDGAIQWQKSIDLSIWNDIIGQNDDSLMYIVDTSIYIRGSVVYGTCNPYFSDTLSILICPQEVIDFDGNIYNTVAIGNQCWMKENLKTTHYSNGDTIPHLSNDSLWASMMVHNGKAFRFCNYDPNSDYGALYTFSAAVNGSMSSDNIPSGIQGVCPYGWHLPSDEEWMEMELSIGMSAAELYATGYRGTIEGGKLKEVDTIHWQSPNTGATNISNFTALPGGYVGSGGWSDQVGRNGTWRSSTQYNWGSTYVRDLSYSNSKILRQYWSKKEGSSVRCVKDKIYPIQGLPEIQTLSVVHFNHNSAQIKGRVLNNGSSTARRGFCLNTTGNPSIQDSVVYSDSGTGTYLLRIEELIPNTTYYLKAFASNSAGTSYGIEQTFTTMPLSTVFCPDSLYDVEGNLYSTVLIGNQCWMQENLKSTYYSDGTPVPNAQDSSLWISLTETDKAYCTIENDTNNIYGVYYTWSGAMNGASSSNNNPSNVQGICPNGWHLPSDAEWRSLEIYLGMVYSNGMAGSDVGGRLKEDNLDHWIFPNVGATNSSGFTALPAGYRNHLNYFQSLTRRAFWWSSTEDNQTNANLRSLDYFYERIFNQSILKRLGMSVRCLRDTGNVQSFYPTVTTNIPSEISEFTAVVGGSIVMNTYNILSKGICWSLNNSPDVNDSLLIINTGINLFSDTLYNLIPNTECFVRAFAITPSDTIYGNTAHFTTHDTLCPPTVTDFDGNIYNTIMIGNQCWMQENVRSVHYSDGTAIPHIQSDSAWAALENNITDRAYCYYNNDMSYADSYGALYTMAAAMNGVSNSNGVQGVCPVGWHLSSDNDWLQLELHLGMSSSEANSYGQRGTDQGSQLAGNISVWNIGDLVNDNQFGSSNFIGLPGGGAI